MWSSLKCAHCKQITLQTSPNIQMKVNRLPAGCSNSTCSSLGAWTHRGMCWELSTYLKGEPPALGRWRERSREKREHFLASVPGTCSRTMPHRVGRTVPCLPLFRLCEVITEPSMDSGSMDSEKGSNGLGKQERKQETEQSTCIKF